MLGVILGLESYAFALDLKWNKVANKRKYTTCSWLVKSVDMKKHEKMLEQVQEYNRSSPEKLIPITGEKEYFFKHIKRGSASEQAAIVMVVFSIIILILHFAFACISDNYIYRTKWVSYFQKKSLKKLSN